MYKIVIDADGLIKARQAGVLALLGDLRGVDPEAAYEAVVTGKLELYGGCFRVGEGSGERTSQEAGLDPRAGGCWRGHRAREG